jgi:hypothetical protein
MPTASITLKDGREAEIDFDNEDQLNETIADLERGTFNQPQANARDPGEVDPVSGKTRAQLESELSAYQEERKPSWRDILTSQGTREAVRDIGRHGRNAVQGVLGLPALAADIADLPRAGFTHAITGEKTYMPVSRALHGFGDPLLEDRDAGERFTSDLVRNIAAIPTGMAAGRAVSSVAGKALPRVAKFGQAMGSSKGQVSSAVGSAIGGSVARENDMGIGGQIAGSILGGTIASAATGATRNFLKSPVGITENAKMLRAKGVDLTPKQMNPRGKFAQVEEGWETLPIAGPIVRQGSDAAKNQWREAAILDAVPPGQQVQKTGDIARTLESVYDSFEPAYDPIKKIPLRTSKGMPVIMNQGADVPLNVAIGKVVSNRAIDASPATRKQAASWLGNILGRKMQTTDDLLSVRSELRKHIHSIKDQSLEAQAKRLIYSNAESKIGEVLESQLSGKKWAQQLKLLKEVDSKYAHYKVVEDAVYRGGKEFSPYDLHQAVKSSSSKAIGKSQYAFGGGLGRDMSEAGEEAFATITPMTGARLANVGGMVAGAATHPLIATPAIGGMGLMAYTKAGRKFAAGEYGFQNALSGGYNFTPNALIKLPHEKKMEKKR